MNYTSIEQSKKLLELGLSPESADMFYFRQIDSDYFPPNVESIVPTPIVIDKNYKENIPEYEYDIPCWSLGSLLMILAEKALEFDDDGSASLSSYDGTWHVNMFDCPIKCSEDYKNPIDACCEMFTKILKS